jgi:hypothetical protein
VSDLRSILRIKNMAANAASATRPDDPYAAPALAETYNRLREEARRLNERAGWSAEDFERELPTIEVTESVTGHVDIARQQRLLGLAREARIALGQLSGWAEGYEQAFVIEESLKAQSQQKKTGFS